MKTWEKNKQYFSSIVSEEKHCLDQPLSYNKEKNIYYYIYPKYNTDDIFPNIDDMLNKIDIKKKL